MNITKLVFLGALLAVGNLFGAETEVAAEPVVLSLEAQAGHDYILQGSFDGETWESVLGPVEGIEGMMDLKLPAGASYERYRLVEFADADSISEEEILSDLEMAERVFPDWFYGFSHGNYYNAGIVGYHATNLVAPKYIVPVAWVSTILNTLSIYAAYIEGFHADAPHVVEAHKDAYGHSEHWMAASASSIVDAEDWMSGYTALSGWMAVFFFNALELTSGSLGWTGTGNVAMWAGIFGDLMMSGYDFNNRVVRYSEVTLSDDPSEQAEYDRAWSGAWIYALKFSSGILPLGVQYLAYKSSGADDYWKGASDTVKWGGRLASAIGAASYIYNGLGSVDHGHSEEKSQ